MKIEEINDQLAPPPPPLYNHTESRKREIRKVPAHTGCDRLEGVDRSQVRRHQEKRYPRLIYPLCYSGTDSSYFFKILVLLWISKKVCNVYHLQFH